MRRLSLASCTGDCNGDGGVTVDELVTATRIVLDETGVSACPNLDRQVDGQITVDEVLKAANGALNGCPAS